MYTVFCGQEAKKKRLAVLTGDRINEVFLEEKFSRFARRPIENGCEVTVFATRWPEGGASPVQ